MKRLKRILAIITVNCAIFAVGLVIIELVFGAWLNTSNLNRLNLLKDCVHQYDVSRLYNDPNPTIQYSRDKYGFRGCHGGPGSIDILTIGGSTTDQRYIRDGETWQDVLQDSFRRGGETFVVANAGVDGQSTNGHIMNFKWWFPFVPDLRPGYILFYVGINDLYIKSGYSFDNLSDADQGFSLKKQIREKSALWSMVRTIRGAYAAMVVHKIGHLRSIDFNKVHWTRDAIQKDYGFMDTRLHEYADRLRLLADMTRELGAEPIFVSQPSRSYQITSDGVKGKVDVGYYDEHHYNGVDYYHMMRKLDSVTETVAMEKNALFIDLAGYTGWVDADFYDYAHMTPRGAKKVGELLYEALGNTVRGRGAEQIIPPNKE